MTRAAASAERADRVTSPALPPADSWRRGFEGRLNHADDEILESAYTSAVTAGSQARKHLHGGRGRKGGGRTSVIRIRIISPNLYMSVGNGSGDGPS